MANITASHIYETTAYDINKIIDCENVNENEFNDRVTAESGGRITEIHVSCGEIIDSIRFSYDYDLDGDTHGGSGGVPHKFTLEEDEYLTQLKWYTKFHDYYGGTVLTGIHFTTNKQRVFKTEGSFMNRSTSTYSFKAKDKHAIVGLKGYCGNYLNQITKVLCRQTDENFKDDKSYYDDYYSLLNAKRLTKVIIHSGLVIDALQIVYDNNREITAMHGGRGGSYSEFPIDENDYITKIKYHTGQVDFTGYGFSQVMLQLELWTKKGKYLKQGLYGRDFSELDSYTRSHISNYHVYSCTMKDNEELFCFAGVYSSYMGRILTVYKRQRSTMKLMSAKQRNSDGKKYLFVCQRNRKDGGTVQEDKAVAALVKLMLDNYHKLAKDKRDKIAFLPNVADSKDLVSSDIIIEEDAFKNAMLSGQYTYISIRSHGTEAGCGNLGAGLMDVKWVRNNKKNLGNALKNTVVNFNCCECGCRNEIEQYKGYNGLARELISAGARAVFAYTIAYLSVENPSVITDTMEKAYYLRFYNLIDNKYMQLIDKNKTPENIAKEVKEDYNKLLRNYVVDILPDISSLNGKEGITFKNSAELVRSFGIKLQKDYPDEAYMYTKDGEASTTGGALKIRDALSGWLKRNLESETSGLYQRLYNGYVDFYTNNVHLVGPGQNNPNSTLKRNNLGELCNDFSNWDGGEL